MKKILLISLSALVLISCTEDFITKEPLAMITNVTFYDNPQNCELAVNAIYDPLGWQNMYQVAAFAYGDVASDDTEKGGGNSVADYPTDQADMNPIATHTATPLNTYLRDWWEYAYIGIARANEMIYRTGDLVTGEHAAHYRRMRGEARFLRAFYYFDLVRLFGPVPLVTQPISPLNAENIGNRADGDDAAGNKQVEAIYNFIISELNAIQNDIPWVYNTENRGRVTAGAAKALLAKVYLFKADLLGEKDGEYKKAYDLAVEVINNGTHELEPMFHDLFDMALDNEYNKEVIFAIQFTSGTETLRGEEGNIRPVYTSPRIFVNPANGQNAVRDGYGYGFNMPRQDLVDAFDPLDPRLDLIIAAGDSLLCTAFSPTTIAWYAIGKVNWNTGFYSLKGTVNYDVFAAFDSQVIGKNIPVIRLGEVYLLAAEAAFKNNDPANALKYVNDIRERARNSAAASIPNVRGAFYKNRIAAGLVGSPSQPPVALTAITLDDIKLERRLELFTEGHRFFDLVRWGDADAVLGAITQDVAGYPIQWSPAKLGRWPIPHTQITLHTGGNLIQNPGY